MNPDTPIPFPDIDLPLPDPGSNDHLPDKDGPYDEHQRKPIWWYHTDHLGSSTYLTDNFGRPSHYYETLPFGEMIVEHNQSSYYKSWNPVIKGKYDNKYKFNGKEFDDATGMYYYGARYYDPRISIFVSVDPLVEQTMTPYQYVHNNPINLIDPTGMSADGWGKKDNTWEYDAEITADNYKDKGYSEYMESGKIFSTTDGKADGEYNYSLNKDGYVQNSYGMYKTESFTTPRGTNIKIGDQSLNMYKSLETTMDIFDYTATTSETFNSSTSVSKSMGTIASVVGPFASYKVNSIEFETGIIDRDRYYFRNTKIVSSTLVGYIMGRYHPAIGLGASKGTSLLFDGIEYSVDYLNKGFNQMKNQVIFSIANARK